ncbi:unnamed protein product [Chondrus crispus]|uniref:Uncharacterized protein n=1 Tax=Chondrus crispus TaxID=2769 RepID=R7QQ81_CHOCR|nr:unnamed protein product [Chondrus crispus]CDF39520.1 unnamed protein product [Chondrus crispus]|eukprot:XP_005719431.1 unnamed protein product [Chondrus crispus]
MLPIQVRKTDSRSGDGTRFSCENFRFHYDSPRFRSISIQYPRYNNLVQYNYCSIMHSSVIRHVVSAPVASGQLNKNKQGILRLLEPAHRPSKCPRSESSVAQMDSITWICSK